MLRQHDDGTGLRTRLLSCQIPAAPSSTASTARPRVDEEGAGSRFDTNTIASSRSMLRPRFCTAPVSGSMTTRNDTKGFGELLKF